MKLPRRQFLHLAAGAAALPARLAHRVGASLSVAAGAHRRRLCRRRRDRHRRAPDRAMAVGAARPAIRHREPAGRRQQYRRPRRSCARPPDGYTLLLVSCGERDQRDALRQAQFQFHPRHRAGRGHHPRARSSWWSIHRFRPRRFPSSSPMPRPIRARSTWHRAATAPRSIVAGELFKMMTGVDMVHVPYRGAAPALTDLLGGQVQVMFDTMPVVDRAHQGRQAARAGGDHRDALGGAAGHPDRGRVRAGLRGERAGLASARRRTRPPRSSTSSTGRSMPASPIPRSRRGLPTRRHGACGLARRFRQAHRRRNREVGQGGEVLRCQAGLIQAFLCLEVSYGASHELVIF